MCNLSIAYNTYGTPPKHYHSQKGNVDGPCVSTVSSFGVSTFLSSVVVLHLPFLHDLVFFIMCPSLTTVSIEVDTDSEDEAFDIEVRLGIAMFHVELKPGIVIFH